MLLDALYPSEQVREQLAPGLNSSLEGDRFKIARRSSVVIPGEASATSDRSAAVLVGRRTTSESVPSSISDMSRRALFGAGINLEWSPTFLLVSLAGDAGAFGMRISSPKVDRNGGS